MAAARASKRAEKKGGRMNTTIMKDLQLSIETVKNIVLLGIAKRSTDIVRRKKSTAKRSTDIVRLKLQEFPKSTGIQISNCGWAYSA